MTGLWRAAVLAILLGMAAPAFADALLQKARELLGRRDPAAAYALLAPLERQRGGEPDYDYLLGLAALDSGRYSDAVFALERVLATRPDDAQARAELARALLALGEREQARRELETVRAQELPPEVARSIERFLDAVERLTPGAGARLTGFLEAQFGYDTNVNAGTELTRFLIPVFPDLGLVNFAGGAQDDAFWGLTGSVSAQYPVQPRWSLVAGATLNQRGNSAQDRFDTGFADGYAGLAYARGPDLLSLVLQGNDYYLDRRRFRDINGALLRWQHAFSQAGQGSVFLQGADLHYPGQDVRDARRWAVGAGYAQALRTRFSPTVYGSFYLGREEALHEELADLAYDFQGMRAGGQLALAAKWLLELGAAMEYRRYEGSDRFFAVVREDLQWDLYLALRYAVVPGWTLVPQIGYTRNDSKVLLNDYDRWVWSLALRRDFE